MEDLLNELKASISEQEEKELCLDQEIPEDFKILDEKTANFFMKKLVEINQEMDEINQMCDAEIESVTQKVNTFRKSKIDTLTSTAQYFNNLLENYAKIQLEGSKKKSVKLPYGSLSFKKNPDNIEYNEQDLLANSDFDKFIEIKRKIKKSELKKAGEIKDGKFYIDSKLIEDIQVVPGETKFNVKLN